VGGFTNDFLYRKNGLAEISRRCSKKNEAQRENYFSICKRHLKKTNEAHENFSLNQIRKN
jgi:hypothetical protein